MVGSALLRAASRQRHIGSLRSTFLGAPAPVVAGSWRRAGGGPAAAGASPPWAPPPGLAGHSVGGTRSSPCLPFPRRLRCCGGALRGSSAVGRSATLTPPLGGTRSHTSAPPPPGTPTVSLTIVERDGTRRCLDVPVGTSVLSVAHSNDIDLEGACEGSLACSTCHVYVDEATFAGLPEACDDELDMLDLAFGLRENSRLGCQVLCEEATDGMVVTLPAATRNMAVDGYVPKPH
ncbi:hypothetical protein MMPV_004478 [Pyropia vietnamensis]